MNQEKSNVSRRTFLAAGSVMVASSLLATETKADLLSNGLAVNGKKAVSSPALLTDDPVTTEAFQTLTNKTISALRNTLITGTESLNIRDIPGHPIVDGDITDALNTAIGMLASSGGQILIPAGNWKSNGGHYFTDAISIEGVGQNFDASKGTEIKLNSGSTNNFLFGITGTHLKCSLKNLRVNLTDKPSAAGLLIESNNNNRPLA